jgi:hypothetical protein
LHYKDDWDKATQRITAWWDGEIIDRVALQVTAPKNREFGKHNEIIKKHSSMGTCYFISTDANLLMDVNEELFANTFYGGEAFPYFVTTLGPSIIGAFLGCELKIEPDTSWQEPCCSSIDDIVKKQFTIENQWYKKINQITEIALRKSGGEYVVTVPDLGSSAEIMAYMLGTEKLCFELMESSEMVKSSIKYIHNLWFKLYDEFYYKTQSSLKGSCMWLSAWAPGKTFPLQCDFSAMISPSMFEEFFLPEIQMQSKFLDYPIYHLDGKEAIKHIDLLLDIPELKAIQWCPGASVGEDKSMLQWIPLLKRIQAKKKSIHIEVNKNEVEPLLKELSPYGLMMRTECSSEEEAQEFLKKVEKWTVK